MSYYSEKVGVAKTDPSRWRLRMDEFGAATWHYVTAEQAKLEPQTDFVKYALECPDFAAPEPETITTTFQAARKGAEFFSLLQEDCGAAPSQYKGPMFMTIGYVAAAYYCKQEIPQAYKTEMIRYLVNSSHPVDGGWGLHSEDKSTCFGTTMNYLILRILGLPKDHPVCVKARMTLHRLGGATGNPHWGKAWLSVLNLYEYEGVNPAPPEAWLLPSSLPFHPGRWWVHVRAIYMPLGYLIMNKVKCELDPLLEQLRTEIYLPKQLPYEKIDFSSYRDYVCNVDLYYPHSTALNVANKFLVAYEKFRPVWFKNYLNNKLYDLIKKDFYNTEYLTIAPVSFAFDMVVAHHRGDMDSFNKMNARKDEVVFHGAQGMTVMGTNGLPVWDTAFLIQYFLMAELEGDKRIQNLIRKGYKLLVRSQFTTECAPGSFRDKRVGGWPFSTKDQGYTVSDCTAEALKAIIMVRNHPDFADLRDDITDERLYQAVDILLALQNRGSREFGSFSAYENIRGASILEKLNPAEVFNNIMIEYPYVECTDSSVLGLTYFHKYYQNYKDVPIQFAIDDAIAYIKKVQRTDGSWYGSWGICFTYASMFALEALNSVGESYSTSESVKKACDFLVAKQRDDGGWSESMKSCETHYYVEGPESYVVQTAWALIGLILADYPDKEPIKKGIQLLMKRQLPTGEWKFEAIEGVFNHSCAIEYPSYKFLFSIKALGLYSKKYGDEKVL